MEQQPQNPGVPAQTSAVQGNTAQGNAMQSNASQG